LLVKAAKHRKASAGIFQAQSRPPLVRQQLFQLDVINRYLPKPPSEAELRGELETIHAESGASGPQAVGQLMGIATKKLAGKADGKAVSALVKELLAP